MLELCHVEKAYGENKVLSDVNVKVNKDEIYGLIGKNGAGKTTIFKIILGLTNYTGDLSIKGSTNENELLESRKKIGFFIGQNFFSYLNAKDNIEYYRQVKGIKDKGEVDRVLKIVDLDGVKVPFKSFSLGMKQRLGIANAILGNPEILILDEPINGLDPQGISDVRNLIKTLNTEYKMTIPAQMMNILLTSKVVENFVKDGNDYLLTEALAVQKDALTTGAAIPLYTWVTIGVYLILAILLAIQFFRKKELEF